MAISESCLREQEPLPLGTDHSTPLLSPATSSRPTLEVIRCSLDKARILLEATDHAIAEYILTQQMASVQHLARELGHDFRNGLMALGAHITQLGKTPTDEERKKKTQNAQNILKNLEILVTHLQTLGNDEAFDDEPALQDLPHQVRRVVDLMRPYLAPSVGIRCDMGASSLPVALLKGDVWRILSNLLLNARDAMPQEGCVTVETYDREVDTEYCRSHGNAHTGSFAIISVEDQGTGIPMEILPRIFDPLFSTKSPSSEGQKRGWGLAIVYTLVGRRGGWIDVESHPGRGARFEVFLPLAKTTEHAH